MKIVFKEHRCKRTPLLKAVRVKTRELNPFENFLFSEECRILEFREGQVLKGKRLMNHVIRSVDVMDQEFCGAQCFMEHNCVSYNYITTSETVKQNCELNNATYEEHEEDLQEHSNYVYSGAKVKKCPFTFQCLFFLCSFLLYFLFFFFCTLEQAPARVSIISIYFFLSV